MGLLVFSHAFVGKVQLRLLTLKETLHIEIRDDFFA